MPRPYALILTCWHALAAKPKTSTPITSCIPDPSPSLPDRDRPLFRKTDFGFSYSYLDPRFAALYTQLEGTEDMHVSHTLDNFTSNVALFSGIEVKRENGDQKEAELQTGIWMAASLRKKMELARRAFPASDAAFPPTPIADLSSMSNLAVYADSPNTATQTPDTNTNTNTVGDTTFSVANLLEPALVIIGHEHRVYYAYPYSVSGHVMILGPDEKYSNLSTRSVQGIFKLVMFYVTISDYGYSAEGKDGPDMAEGEGCRS